MGTDKKTTPSSDVEQQGESSGARDEREGVEGEGSYTATRRYNADIEKGLKEQNTEELAEAARKALEGPEGPSLEEAEKVGKSKRRD
jgi:hypothetical protein